jgi:LPXTG-motif cell wall-anchored protein
MRKLALCAAVLLTLLVATPAQAAGASVSVSPSTADPDYATVVKLRGSGFQSVPRGYGGIYVLFGWVADGNWQPSKGGAAGETYRYVQDKETKDNKGFQRFVTFPGGDTASAANGGELAADGTWSSQLVIPGARFKAADRGGNVIDVDCTKVLCGLITVGAHGVVNANNETFTPVTFSVPQKAAAPPPPPAPATTVAPTSATPAPPSTSATPTPSPSPVVTETPAPSVQPAAQTGESTSNWWIVVVAAVLVLLAALIVPLVRLRKRRAVTTTPENSEEGK